MKINIGNSEKLFKWLMKKYDDMMKVKSFKGPKPALYESILRQSPDKLIILQAFINDNPIAGQMYIKHGKASTYLVGWNSNEGRKYYAHNLLTWNAILKMKRNEIDWFDLGGIDEIKLPGITKFKRGLNGNEFILSGNWFI